MKVAIIGSGISGLVCGYLLYKDFDISIFEANDYIGGHTHTIDITREDGSYAVDTGFIVFNRTTYPNFCKLIDQLLRHIGRAVCRFVGGPRGTPAG